MSNEAMRIIRTVVQALVAMAVTYVASLGVNLEVDSVMIVVFPIVIALVTALVRYLGETVPGIGWLIAILNGPAADPDYGLEG